MNKPLDPAALASDQAPLYAPRKQVYPQSVSGTFRNIKWALMAFCLAVYYILPFVRWDRGPNAPSQAVLIDFPTRRFYFFFIELWPQEVYYFTGLLIIAAMTLFLMNARRRPHLVRLSLPADGVDRPVLRGGALDRGRPARAHAKADGRLTARHVGEIAAKHSIWLFIAWWTGGAWVLYFADAPTLVKQLATFQAPAAAYVWIAHPHLHHLHAGRPHARAGVRLHVPVAAHPGGADRRMGAQRHLSLRSRRAAHLDQEGRGAARPRTARPAIASTAISASRSVRPASTSATAPSSAASCAGCASTPATPS